MDSFACITESDRSDNQCSDCGTDCVAELGCTTNEVKSNGLLPASECSVDSTHGDKHNKECFKCFQVKVDSELKPVLDEYKNCRKIGDYLEKGKDDNYFEKYLLPAKVLSKFALLLGKSDVLFFFVFFRGMIVVQKSYLSSVAVILEQ